MGAPPRRGLRKFLGDAGCGSAGIRRRFPDAGTGTGRANLSASAVSRVGAPEQCRPLLEELRAQRGLLGFTLQPGASLQPPGDVIGLVVLSRTYSAFTRVLDRHGVGRVPGTSYRSSEPVSVVSTSAPQIATDTSASSWEEMELTLAKESQFTVDVALLMFVAGFIAAVGIASGAVHAIAGAMVIAPGFEPCVRVVLGGMTRSVSWRRGAYSLVAGYALLVLGAATAAVIMRASGTPLLTGSGSYHRTDVLVTYWTTLSMGQWASPRRPRSRARRRSLRTGRCSPRA